jgi:mRNA interferase MazF
MFVKRFLEWIGIKAELDAHDFKPPLVSEGDLWWCSIGENVGIETSGKGHRFTRPVIVLKKFGRLAFFGIPTTTKERAGSWYFHFTHKGIRETALLSQARMFSYKRLDRKMGSLDETDFANAKQALLRLLTE